MKTVTAIQLVDRIQDQDDVTNVAVDGRSLVFDAASGKFVPVPTARVDAPNVFQAAQTIRSGGSTPALSIQLTDTPTGNTFEIRDRLDAPRAYVDSQYRFFGNGSGLTNLDPTKLTTGTAVINITGRASTADFVDGGSY